jgi:hypothetical protein
MREDALYYSQREQVERSLADNSADDRVRAVHTRLADKYQELARRELANMPMLNRIAL